jgi:hypothetical protein
MDARQFVQQNFGGHNQDLRIGVDFDVASDESERYIGILCDEFVVFLVSQRFNRRGVDDFFP